MMLGTVVPTSICRDMQHAFTKYARQARDKMEEDGGVRMTREQDFSFKPPFREGHQSWPFREQEGDRDARTFLHHSRVI